MSKKIALLFKLFSEETLFADPLANKQIPSLAMLLPPLVTSLRFVELSDNYQRAQRHYIGNVFLKDF